MYQTWFCGVQLEISAISGSGAGSAEAGDSAGVELGQTLAAPALDISNF